MRLCRASTSKPARTTGTPVPVWARVTGIGIEQPIIMTIKAPTYVYMRLILKWYQTENYFYYV